jgi:hypothetical protein
MIWIDLAHNRDQERALVHRVMNLNFPYYVAKFLGTCKRG